MTDRVYPSKPAANGGSGGGNPPLPANKAQLYNAARPMYRPQPPRRRRGRSCFCSCCLFITLVVIVVLLLVAIAGAVFWVLYRPHRPSFSVSSIQISQLSLTSTSPSRLNSRFNLTVSARNPNKKISYLYDPIAVSITSGGTDVGDGSVLGFTQGTRNTTTLRTVVTNAGQTVDSTAVGSLRSDLRSKSLTLKIQMDTQVKAKIGGLKTKKMKVRITCDGIRAAVPAGKSAAPASISDAKCKIDLRFKIWKWNI